MSAGDGNASGTIQSVSREARSFPPPADFAARALINDAAAYEKLYRRSIDDPEGFWAETARAELTWSRDFKKVLDWKLLVDTAIGVQGKHRSIRTPPLARTFVPP